MSDSSPFWVLGLNPEALRGLTDEQISEMVKSQYRKLQIFHHPDKSGGKSAGSSGDRAGEIAEAYSRLDRTKYPDAFEVLKNEFLRKSRSNRRIDESRKMLTAVQEELETRKTALNKLFRGCFSLVDELTVFNLQEVNCLRMLDIVRNINQNEAFLGRFQKWHKRKDKRLVSGFFYLLHIGPVGLRTEREQGTKEYPNRKLAGCISRETEEKFSGFKNILKTVSPITTPEEERMMRDPALSSSRARPCLSGEVSLFGNEILEEIFFSHFVHLLTPRIEQDSILFSVENNPGKRPRFFIEGKVLGIE